MKKSRDATVSKKALVDKTLDENGQPKTFSLGHKKHFYLDIEYDDEGEAFSWRSEGEGSLEGIGYREDGSPLCYVWVLGQVTGYDDKDDSVLFTEESSLTTEKTAPIGKVNRAMAQDYADTVEKYLYNGIEYNHAMSELVYGSAFSFIGWLMRTYSVATMVSIAQNEYLDWEGIVKGVNALTDENGKHYSESIESLLRDYSAACIRGMKASASQEELFFTARAPSEEGKGVYCREENYGYPLIDIKIKGLNTAESTGFQLYDANQVADLRPYGMMLHNVGSTTSDDDTVLTFSSDSEPSPMEKLYLVIICK